MTGGKIDVDKLPTIDFSLETDPASPEDGRIWWNETEKLLKIADPSGVYTFNGTLSAWDTTPAAFTFTDITNATTETLYTSNAITVSGINHPSVISVSGDASAKYSVNNATATATNGTVESGDEVRAVVTSSASAATAVNATVTIGGVSDVFSVTTAEASGGSVACSGSFTSGDNESFENGTGTLCTTGLASTGLANGLNTYSDAWANCGTHSVLLTNSGGNVNAIQADMGAMTTKYFRFYLNPAGLTSSGTYTTTNVFQVSGNTTGGHQAAAVSLRRGNTSQYQLVTTVTGYTEVAINPAEILRVEVKVAYNGVDTVTETYRVKKYSGGSWVTLIDDATKNTGVGLAPRYVSLKAAAINVYVDDIQSGSDWIGEATCE